MENQRTDLKITQSLKYKVEDAAGYADALVQISIEDAACPFRSLRRTGLAIDSYRFLDFASRQIIKAWANREAGEKRSIPWTPPSKPLADSTVALVTTAGVARIDDQPFDQERERQNPWWGDPTYRTIPQGTTEGEVKLYHMHIDTRFGQEDLDVVLPMRRLAELAGEGAICQPADIHYSIMGYQLRTQVLEGETAPAIAREMKARGVDTAALVPA